MKTTTLSLDLETLVELTPEDAQRVNGGSHVQPTRTAMTGPVSSVLPPQPTPPVPAPLPTPPVHKHHHHHHHHR